MLQQDIKYILFSDIFQYYGIWCRIQFIFLLILQQDTEYSFVGESNASACDALVKSSLFNFSSPCNFSHCSFNGIFQPPVFGDYYVSISIIIFYCHRWCAYTVMSVFMIIIFVIVCYLQLYIYKFKRSCVYHFLNIFLYK